MGEFFTNLYNSIISLANSFRVADLLDVVVVAFLIFSLVKLVRETRAEQLVKGILILVLAYFVSSQLQLKMLSTLLDNFFQFSVLALLVVFQPELRRALEQIGRSKIGKYWSFAGAKDEETLLAEKIRKGINGVVDAASSLQRQKTGALIVFERETKLGDIIDTGTIVDAKPAAPLICNIFFNKAPLHDGAMIIREGSVYAAGCILPLTKSGAVSIDLGTRHRAAIGMSENSDAVVVVVSEETGTISMAVNGVLTRNYTRETLRSALESVLVPESLEDGEKKPLFSSLRKGKKHEKE